MIDEDRLDEAVWNVAKLMDPCKPKQLLQRWLHYCPAIMTNYIIKEYHSLMDKYA